jgi:hypothetical protein
MNTGNSEREWTDEEVENMQKYGVCMICWEPRFAKLIEVEPGTWQHFLTCKNGHRSW